MLVHRQLAAAALILVLAGCDRPEVASYTIPKEAPSDQASGEPPAAPFAANGGGSMAGAQVPTVGGPGLSWTAPVSWQAKPLSAMRKGSFAVTADGQTADLSITAFPGDVGGELANVNRWRGQVQLPPLDESNLGAGITRLSVHGLPLTVVDLKGDGPQRILGAIVPYSDGTWFFKLMGPDAVVSQAKADFMAFLQTITPPATP